MTYRNRKLLDLAHDAPCFLMISGKCTSAGFVSGECVPCHSDQQIDGRGTGHKSHDCLAIPGCVNCHEKFTMAVLGRTVYEHVHNNSLKRYLVWLWENEKVRVA